MLFAWSGLVIAGLVMLATRAAANGYLVVMYWSRHGLYLLERGADERYHVFALYRLPVVLLRYFETMGEIRQAISVMKKRSGVHERTIRELRLDSQGIRVGEPLKDFHGVLTGVPVYTGESAPLLLPRE